MYNGCFVMVEEIGSGPPNKVKVSLYRKQIDEMIKERVSARVISSWLKNQDPPESIGKTAIYGYINEIFPVEKKAVQEYSDRKSEERLDDAVRCRVSEIEKLQAFADEALSVGLDLDIQVDERTTVLDIEKHKLQVKRAGVYAQKVVNDFLKAVEPEKSVDVKLELSLDDRVREYERRFEAARDGGDRGDGV